MAKECKYRQDGICVKAGVKIPLLTCEKNCPVPPDPCDYLEVEQVLPADYLGVEAPNVIVAAVCKKGKELRQLSGNEIKTCTKNRYAEECVRKK